MHHNSPCQYIAINITMTLVLCLYCYITIPHNVTSVTYSDIIMFTCGVGLATPDNIAMLCMGTPILHYNFVTWTGVSSASAFEVLYFHSVCSAYLYIASDFHTIHIISHRFSSISVLTIPYPFPLRHSTFLSVLLSPA